MHIFHIAAIPMSFVPAVFRFSLGNYFKLTSHDISRLCVPHDARRLAFFGDTVLQFECLAYLNKNYRTATLHDVNSRKCTLVCNKTLAVLFDKVFSADLKNEDTQNWGIRKKGTIVEAAIQLSYERNGESARPLVRAMVKWVDMHANNLEALPALAQCG